jgi:predicted transposase YbfD/YdcC
VPGTGVFFPLYTEIEKGHGRIEKREIRVTQRVAGLRFPGCQQAFRVERTSELSNGKTRHEICYGVTSLGQDQASELDLLHLLRGHWQVEALHYIRDRTYDEDRSRIREGSGPQVMAALRNLAIAFIKKFVPGSVAHGNRHLAQHHDELLRLVGA